MAIDLQKSISTTQPGPPYTPLPLLIILITGISITIGIIALHVLELHPLTSYAFEIGLIGLGTFSPEKVQRTIS